MADTINERFMDFQIAQQIKWIRLQNKEAKDVLKILNRADKEIARLLRNNSPVPGSFSEARIQALQIQIRNVIDAVHAQTGAAVTDAVTKAAQTSADIEEQLFKRALPAGLDVTTPNPGVIMQAATLKPFNGDVLGGWIENVKQADLNRTWRHVLNGVVTGVPTPELIRSLNNEVRNVSRRGMEALVRTSINHATNQGRQALWEQNADIISSIRWVATLDGRTSPICRDRDGKVGPVSPAQENWQPPSGYTPLDPLYARPPAHPNCRSTTVAVTKSWRELGFDVDDMPPGQRASMDGAVPADTTYYQWLAKQSEDVQKDVLGKSRFDMWKSGKVTPDKFFNDGRFLTIDDLRKDLDVKPNPEPVPGLDWRKDIDQSDPLSAAFDVESKIKNVVDLSEYRPTDFGLTTWGNIADLYSDGKISHMDNIGITNDAHMIIIASVEGRSTAEFVEGLSRKLISAGAIKPDDVVGLLDRVDPRKLKPVPPKPDLNKKRAIGTPKDLVKKDKAPSDVLKDQQKGQDPHFHPIVGSNDVQPEIPWESANVVSTVSRSKRLKDRVDDTAFRAFSQMPNWVLNEISDVYTIDLRKRRASYDFYNYKLNMSYENHWTVWVHEMFHALDFKYRNPRGTKSPRERLKPRDSLDWNTSDLKLNKLAAETRQEFIDRDSKGTGRYKNGDGRYWLGDWDRDYEGRKYEFDQDVSSEYITMAAQEYARARAAPDLPNSKAQLKRMKEKQPKMLALLKYIWGDD